MSASYRIAKLKKSDKTLFVSLMSKSFARDPFFLHVFGDSELDKKASSSVTAFVSFNLLGDYIVEHPRAGELQIMVGGLLLIGRLIPLFDDRSKTRGPTCETEAVLDEKRKS